MPKKLAVSVNLPRHVDVSIRGASTAIRVDVRINGKKRGSLNIGSGSVAWWPANSVAYGHRISWSKLIRLFEESPSYPIAKKLGKKKTAPAEQEIAG